MSMILAGVFVLSASSVAGSSEGSMPGVGTFAYLDASWDGLDVARDGTASLASWTK
ncbi:hypothetical protein [Rhodopseudomonas telluris]|uniref:Uncharacterized protein n=1 Tax=Rhodopseudomonas telluris TaxID=644215 RepID=A0ABV6EXV5_9BRAD